MDLSSPASPLAPAYKDRRTGLIVFGIVEILLGCFFLLAVPVSVIGQIAAARKSGTDLNAAFLLSSLVTVAALATSLVWLGIGSIMARRWARALLLCGSWMGLCAGAVSLTAVILSLSGLKEMLQQQGHTVSPAMLAVTQVILVATTVIFYVIIPGALVIFYRSPHVRATCEALDPVPRWTDRCPLPVLAVCMLQVYGAFSVLAMMAQFGSVFPMAGTMVTGWTARVLWLGFIGFSLYAARGFYRLNPRTWLAYTVVLAIGGLSSIITFLRVDLLEYYRMAGLPEHQIRQLAGSPLLRGRSFVWLSAIGVLLFAGYLIYLRRYFVGNKNPTAPT